MSQCESRIFYVGDVLAQMRIPVRKVKPLINFNISATWKGGSFTSLTMMFPNSIAAQMWARDQFGIEPKIKVTPA